LFDLEIFFDYFVLLILLIVVGVLCVVVMMVEEEVNVILLDLKVNFEFNTCCCCKVDRSLSINILVVSSVLIIKLFGECDLDDVAESLLQSF
jgi:hypothetical protein